MPTRILVRGVLACTVPVQFSISLIGHHVTDRCTHCCFLLKYTQALKSMARNSVKSFGQAQLLDAIKSMHEDANLTFVLVAMALSSSCYIRTSPGSHFVRDCGGTHREYIKSLLHCWSLYC